MDEPQRPAELSEEAWQATAPEARQLIALLVAKLAALEARLNQNSQNSSRPPSSNPPLAPPRPAKTPRGKPKTKGAQPGHPDQQRELLPEAEVDTIVPLRPTCCSSCQRDLPASLPALGLPRRQQVFELPEFKPLVTEYQYHTVCCPSCRSLVTAERPADVPPGSFGPRAVALIALLHGRYRISNRELVTLLQMVWLLPVSLGSVANLQQVASAALAPAHAEAQAAIADADQVNADETRWREGPRKPWLWVAVSALATVFLVEYGRGKKQLRRLLGERFTGLVTSDRFSAYTSLEPKRRQLCWAHIVRNLRGRAEASGPWQADAAALLALAEEVLVIWAMHREGALDRATTQGLLNAIAAAMWELVERGRQQTNTLGAICSELSRLWEALWTFVDTEGIEPTNNAAERALRPAVLWRKGCYGTQSEAGSRFVERMLTVSATCQQHDRPLLPYLVEAITALWAGQTAPRLLPSNLTP
ncbi:MAG: IS66 family transposase [Chloroflexales bacterium]|nr:IS66 family transposase [Chloroflexales bacterium]